MSTKKEIAHEWDELEAAACADTAAACADTKKTAEAKGAEKTAEAKGAEADLEKLVTVIVERDNSAKKSKTIRLSLNGKSIVIPRGVAVEVPLKYKLLLVKKEKLRELDDRYKEELAKALEEEK